MRLSVIVPVYNENKTVRHILEVIRKVPVDKEIVIVDDGSTDGTRDVLRAEKQDASLRIIYHDTNHGKGAAVCTGIQEARGDAIIIQDADMEYDPMDYLPLLKAMKETGSKAVFGSRFLGKKGASTPWHRFVNGFLTRLTNLLFGSDLTDMETCYKLYDAALLKSLDVRSSGFEVEVELTAKTLTRGERIVEVPISYKGRSYHEGKKIGWKDGLKAVFCLFKYRLARP